MFFQKMKDVLPIISFLFMLLLKNKTQRKIKHIRSKHPFTSPPVDLRPPPAAADAAEAGDDAAGELAVLPADGAGCTAHLAVRPARQSRLSGGAGRLILTRSLDTGLTGHGRRSVGNTGHASNLDHLLFMAYYVLCICFHLRISCYFFTSTPSCITVL